MLRAIAALIVLIYHATGWQSGGAGVDLFFVISGFIIATVAPRHSPVSFLLDRTWRIYPPYFLAVVPFLAFAWLQGKLSLARTFTTLTLVPFPTRFVFEVPYLQLGWTLSFELLFYAAAAVTLLRTSAFLPLLIYLIALIGCLSIQMPTLCWLGSPIIAEFLLGVWIARRGPTGGTAFPITCIVCGVVLLLTSGHIVYGPETAINPQVAIVRLVRAGVPAALLVYGFIQIEGRFVGRFWSVPVEIGDASYSLYLWHFIILELVGGFVGIAASIAFALFLRRAVEQPLERFRHERLRAVQHHFEASQVRFDKPMINNEKWRARKDSNL